MNKEDSKLKLKTPLSNICIKFNMLLMMRNSKIKSQNQRNHQLNLKLKHSNSGYIPIKMLQRTNMNPKEKNLRRYTIQ